MAHKRTTSPQFERQCIRAGHSGLSYGGNSAFLFGRGEEFVGALVRLDSLDRVAVVRDVGLAAYQRLVLVLGDASNLHLRRDRNEKAHAATVRRWGRLRRRMHMFVAEHAHGVRASLHRRGDITNNCESMQSVDESCTGG